jgi:hypothetical protein
MLLRPKSPPVAGTQKQDLNVIFTAHVFPLPCLYVVEEDFPLQWMNVCVVGEFAWFDRSIFWCGCVSETGHLIG